MSILVADLPPKDQRLLNSLAEVYSPLSVRKREEHIIIIASSIDLFTRPDYGYITNAATEEVDHGPLDIVYYPETGWISLQDARLDYQYISDVATIYPFGILPFTSDTKIAFLPNYVGSGTLRLSGEVYIFFPPVHEGEGSFSISGHAEERFVSDEVFQTLFEFNDSATDRTSVREISDVELEIFGSAEEKPLATHQKNRFSSPSAFGITSFIPRYNGLTHIDIDGGLVAERSTFSEVVEGNLFSFISKEERRTYHYNTSSNNIFETPDYGYVSQVATETADHGSLDIVYYPETGWISTPDARLDYESISRHSSDYAFGIFPLKGAAHTPRARDFIGFGNLFFNRCCRNICTTQTSGFWYIQYRWYSRRKIRIQRSIPDSIRV